jgi:hypothetical protein
MTIWHMHISCWIPKATNILPEYAAAAIIIILIIIINNNCFSLATMVTQKPFSGVCYTGIPCLV